VLGCRLLIGKWREIGYVVGAGFGADFGGGDQLKVGDKDCLRGWFDVGGDSLVATRCLEDDQEGEGHRGEGGASEGRWRVWGERLPTSTIRLLGNRAYRFRDTESRAMRIFG
jgi:hypothetical protein